MERGCGIDIGLAEVFYRLINNNVSSWQVGPGSLTAVIGYAMRL